MKLEMKELKAFAVIILLEIRCFRHTWRNQRQTGKHHQSFCRYFFRPQAKEKAVLKTETPSTHFLAKHEESNEIGSLVKRLI